MFATQISEATFTNDVHGFKSLSKLFIHVKL